MDAGPVRVPACRALWMDLSSLLDSAERRELGVVRAPSANGANVGRSRTPGPVQSSDSFMSALPSATCKSEPGSFAPVVDRSKCEGKATCVEVCPVHVFEVRRIDEADFAQLGVLAKLKSIAHGRKTAYTPKASACEACAKCVEACPEKAIKLARVSV